MALNKLLWLASRVLVVAVVCRDMARVLREFAVQLRIGQRLYEEALARKQALEANPAPTLGVGLLPGHPARLDTQIAEAEADMAQARARVESANAAAAEQVQRLTAQLPDLASEPSPNRNTGWSASEVGHTVLDVFGLVPLVGEPADAANAAWYAAEGEYTNAALSAAAMVPFVGWAATGGKLGIKGVTLARSADDVRAFAKKRHSLVPEDATREPFHNDRYPGEAYKWTDPKTGKTVRYEAHGRDPTRSVEENAGRGPTYGMKVGNHYLDAQGNRYTMNSLNDRSSAFNPEAPNATHIPYPKGEPPPGHFRFVAPNPAGLAGPDGDQR